MGLVSTIAEDCCLACLSRLRRPGRVKGPFRRILHFHLPLAHSHNGIADRLSSFSPPRTSRYASWTSPDERFTSTETDVCSSDVNEVVRWPIGCTVDPPVELLSPAFAADDRPCPVIFRTSRRRAASTSTEAIFILHFWPPRPPFTRADQQPAASVFSSEIAQ